MIVKFSYYFYILWILFSQCTDNKSEPEWISARADVYLSNCKRTHDWLSRGVFILVHWSRSGSCATEWSRQEILSLGWNFQWKTSDGINSRHWKQIRLLDRSELRKWIHCLPCTYVRKNFNESKNHSRKGTFYAINWFYKFHYFYKYYVVYIIIIFNIK